MSDEQAEMDPAVQAKLAADALDFQQKMKYIGLQIQMLEPAEKAQFTHEVKGVGKSLNTLRKALAQKERAEMAWYEFNWLMIACVFAMLLIFG